VPACPQYPALSSLLDSKNLKLEDEVRKEIGGEQFFDKSLKRLQGAVKIRTESFNDMGQVGEDP
jgi:Gly-Xaa carboxypeptidase